mmetsp:Transcript_18617/g.46095  ORF Transcript_18617/g.46095 Transcript_18617/m.46095 type:complete len:481 (-) Transcript_18617:172-1614(-)
MSSKFRIRKQCLMLSSLCLLLIVTQLAHGLSLEDPNMKQLAGQSRRLFLDTVTSTTASAVAASNLGVSTAFMINDDGENTNNLGPVNSLAAQAAETSSIIISDSAQAYTTKPSAGRFYFPALTPPFANRATFKYDLGRNAWALEQLLTFANVTATIRCTVIQLETTGGLWVHSPQWPTGEFCALLDEIGAPVEHVVLPCNAFEHKAPMQAFTEKYPNANVWISPGQFGPLGSCGKSLAKDSCQMGYRVDGILGLDNPLPPWSNEFDMATLYLEIPKNAGPVSEVSFFHRPTKTLVATDSVIYVPKRKSPPELFSTYFDRDTIEEDPTFWPRTVLQAIFLPLRQDDNGNYPSYEVISDRLVRAPILRALVDARAPNEVREWIAQQTTPSWDFDRILTSHFESPISAGPTEYKAAFGYLDDKEYMKVEKEKLTSTNTGKVNANLPAIQCQDWELLDSINQVVAKSNAGAPATFDFQRGCISE